MLSDDWFNITLHAVSLVFTFASTVVMHVKYMQITSLV